MGARLISILIFLAIAVGLMLAVTEVASGWADWVVFGVIVLTTFGAAVAVNQRKYPLRKRAYTRQSDDKFRR